jgi:hypothetical protein
MGKQEVHPDCKNWLLAAAAQVKRALPVNLSPFFVKKNTIHVGRVAQSV